MPTTFIPLDYLHEMSHETSHISKYMEKKNQNCSKKSYEIQNFYKVNAHFVNNSSDNWVQGQGQNQMEKFQLYFRVDQGVTCLTGDVYMTSGCLQYYDDLNQQQQEGRHYV